MKRQVFHVETDHNWLQNAGEFHTLTDRCFCKAKVFILSKMWEKINNFQRLKHTANYYNIAFTNVGNN